MSKRTFRIAPMSPLMWLLTIVALSVPACLFWLRATPMIGVGIALVTLYAAVWLYWRPLRFEVSSRDLYVVWPLRKERIGRGDITRVSKMDMAAFKARFGWSVRIGVGGLFGQFGYAWTSREGMVRTYITTMGPFVLVERHEGRALLITPERIDELVSRLA